MRLADPDAATAVERSLPPVADDELPRLFALWRHRDPTGQSGTGVVLFGVAFPGGPVLTRWRGVTTGIYQLGLWNSVDEILAVHGHHGCTELIWLSNPTARRDWDPKLFRMRTAEVLIDALDRVRDVVHGAVTGLSEEQLAWRADPAANSIAWLVWHLTRVQDDHIADVAGTDQVWGSGWADRFGLPLPPADTGYGHTSDQVARVRAGAELLTGYHDAVYEQSRRYLDTLTDADLDRIVDEAWDPPVTLGVRLVSVVTEDNQHAGQAAYLRGLVERR